MNSACHALFKEKSPFLNKEQTMMLDNIYNQTMSRRQSVYNSKKATSGQNSVLGERTNFEGNKAQTTSNIPTTKDLISTRNTKPKDEEYGQL